MRGQFQIPLVLGTLMVLSPGLRAQPDLQHKLKDAGIGAHWVYDDIAKGFEQAKTTGKPLLVLFR